MNLKKGLIGTAVALALLVPATTYAATSTSSTAIKIRGLFGIDTSKLTAAQQADVTDYAKKMADLQKSLLDKMVSNGSITQAQADAKKAQIDTNLASGDIFAGGKGDGRMRGGFDISKLTDAQKNTLLDLKKQQLTLQNDLAKLLVDQKLITQAQADTIKTNVDAAISSLTTSNLTNHEIDENGRGSIGMLQGITLTDTQKTALLGWTAQASAVQKKIVALYKDAGVITAAQADAMNTQIDTKATDPLSFNMTGDGRMGDKMGDKMGGRMGGKHGHNS